MGVEVQYVLQKMAGPETKVFDVLQKEVVVEVGVQHAL